MSSIYSSFGTRKTPQNEPIPGEVQIKNNAGGFVYGLDKWKMFERFLILGSEGGSYYVAPKELTKQNALNTMACIDEDGEASVRKIVEVSVAGRAAKNDPAIFALALAAAAKDPKTRALALANLGEVCRIPTHLFHFVTYVRQFRGLGRGLRTALGNWYNEKDLEALAYHGVKYQSRDGWSNADVLRLSHPKTKDATRNSIYRWMLNGLTEESSVEHLQGVIMGFEKAKKAEGKELLGLIRDHNLSREMVPTESLKDPAVWEALLERMPLEATIRNLGNMSKVELLKPLSDAANLIQSRLTNVEMLKKARIHPLAILVAMKIYAQGRGMKGDGAWVPVPSIVDALDEAFYKAFDFVEPTNKRHLIACDISGSMGWGVIAGMPITPLEAAGALAMTIARTEPNSYTFGFGTRFTPLGITPRMRLTEVIAEMGKHGMQGTDCAIPMLHAEAQKLNVDAFVVITDNETWAGKVHPSQALRSYRQKSGINAAQVVIATTPTPFSIADPKDPRALDVVGFDTSVPTVISNFIRG